METLIQTILRVLSYLRHLYFSLYTLYILKTSILHSHRHRSNPGFSIYYTEHLYSLNNSTEDSVVVAIIWDNV